MAATDARASPRKPIVCKVKRSSAERIFEVACLSKLKRASVTLIPMPLSITWINVLPASRMMSWIWLPPASIAFSNNSFTAEAGR
jgi:hypothetical protein